MITFVQIAPTTGQNGGYIDPTQLTYHILNGIDQSTIVAMRSSAARTASGSPGSEPPSVK